MKKPFNYLLLFVLTIFIASCGKKGCTDPNATNYDPDATKDDGTCEVISAPTVDDAAFTYAPSSGNPNIIEFTAVNSDMSAYWDFGNGTTGTGPSVSATYPNAGTYTVELIVSNSAGSNSSSQDIVIDQTDPSLLNNPIYTFLTGGVSGTGSKTWVIDSASATHFGVGPDPIGAAGNFPEWWAANPNDKPGCGLYNDRYVFHLNNFQFDMVVNGDVYVNNELSADFPGSYENLTDYTAPYTDQMNETWTLTEDADTTLSVSGDSFIGFWTGVRDYKIINVSDTSLWLQYTHHSGGLLWYLRLIPEGFVSSGTGGGGGGGPTTPNVPDTVRVKLENSADPNQFVELDATVTVFNGWEEVTVDFTGASSNIYDRVVLFPGWDTTDSTTYYMDDIKHGTTLLKDFETGADSTWTTFGNSSYNIIANPDASGINTSSYVLETKHGNETWAGLFFNLSAPLDFSSETTVSVKVWTPQ